MENPDGLSWFIMVYHNGPAYLIEMTILGKKIREKPTAWCHCASCGAQVPLALVLVLGIRNTLLLVSFRMDIV